MRSLSSKINLLLVSGVVILLLTWSLDPAGGNLLKKVYQAYTLEVLQNQVNRKESEAYRTWENIINAESAESWIHDNMQPPLPDNMHLFLYEHDSLVYWTTADVLPAETMQDYWTFTELANGYYLQKTMHSEDVYGKFLMPLKKNYSTQNEYLRNYWQLPGPPGDQLKVHAPPVTEKGRMITNINGEPLFAVTGNIPLTTSLESFLVILALSGFFLIIAYCHVNTAIVFKTRQQLKGITFLTLGTVFIVICWQWLSFPDALFSSNLFSSRYYAVTNWLSSMGDLMVLAFLFCWWIYFLVNYINWGFPSTRHAQMLFSFGFVLPVFVAGWGLEALIQSLVLHSNIILNPTRIFELSIFSLLAYLILFSFLLGGFIMSYYLFRVFYYCNLISGYVKIAIILLSLLFCLTLYYYFENAFGWIFLLPLGFWFIFYAFQKEKQRKALYLRYIVLVVLFTAFLVSWRIMHYENAREQENKRLMVNRIIDEGDAIFEFHFNRQYDELENDPFFRGYFTNPLIPPVIIKKRLEELYFAGHMNKYELRLHSYSSDSTIFKTPQSPGIDFLNEKRSKASTVIDGKLYYLSGQRLSPGYLAFIHIHYTGDGKGLMVLEFNQKTYFEESIYPELLLGKRQGLERKHGDVSFAMYNRGELTSRRGDFAYPHYLPSGWATANDQTLNLDNTIHFIQSFDEHTVVVLSREERGAFYLLAAFSSVFIIFTVFVFFSALLRGLNLNRSFRIKSFLGLINPRQVNPLRNMQFGAKVQLAIVIAVLAALVITGFVTGRYIMVDFNNRERQELQNQTRQVLSNMESEAGTLSNLEPAQLSRLVQQMSGRFRVDVNLYNAGGNLISSSQPEIFERGIISSKMHPRAYRMLMNNGRSHLVQEEQIGELSYIASYFPIRNPDNGRITSFLSLPYFGKETELEQQISTLLATLVNLYLFMFILTALASVLISNTLTKPFQMISDKLKKIKLGKDNEPIRWSSEDEVGQLIREYNAMIHQLEKSAERLADNERELAWREMARQVAHEIKNPLTPMKLSIQRLQMQYKPDNPKTAESFQKTTNLLIHQIENLARIASEFSSFAKMPTGDPKKLELNAIVEQSLELFIDHEVDVKLHKSEVKCFIQADPNQLERVFSNLISNSVEAIQHGGGTSINVYIKTYPDEQIGEVWIEDDGPGIPPDMQNRIFQPNFSTKSRGMGLGLSICRKILEQTGASIRLDPNCKTGARFIVSFKLT